MSFRIVFIILNFNALSDAYTVQIQSYTGLFKSNRIFWLMLGITFGNYFSTVCNEGDDHLCLYFVQFLNYLPMYEEINRQISSQKHSYNLNSILSSLGWKVFIIYARCMICLSCFSFTQIYCFSYSNTFAQDIFQ